MLARMEKQENIFGQHELVEIMRQDGVADIVIFGSGSTFPDSDGHYSITYTFQAVRLSDTAVLGVASVSRTLDGATQSELASEIADEAILSLICEMKQAWEPPNHLSVRISGASSVEDIYLLLSTIASRNEADGRNLRVIGRQDIDLGVGQGFATFSLEYSCPFGDLVKELRDLSDSLPYNLVMESLNAGKAELRIEV